MGIKDIGKIKEVLDKMFPQSVYPRRLTEEEVTVLLAHDPSISKADLIDLTVEPDFTDLDYVIDDSNAQRLKVQVTPVIRAADGSVSPGVHVSRAERTVYSEDSVFFQSDTSITTYGELAERMYSVYNRYLAMPSVKAVLREFDHIGATPRAKEIHYNEERYVKPSNPIFRPPNKKLFEMNAPIYNDINDIFADQEARREYLSFLAWYGFNVYAKSDALPPGKMLIIHGGYMDGKKLSVPYCAVKQADGSVRVGEYTAIASIPPDSVHFVCGEADVAINSWIIHFGAHSNVLVISKDGDIEAILFARIQDRVRAMNNFDQVGKLWLCSIKGASKADSPTSTSPSGSPNHARKRGADSSEDSDDKLGAGDLEFESYLAGGGLPQPPAKKQCTAEASATPIQKKITASGNLFRYVNMKERYQGMFHQIMPLQKMMPESQRNHPVELFLLVCFMLNKDYVKPLGGITFGPLIETLLTSLPQIGRLLDNDTRDVHPNSCSYKDHCHRVRRYRIQYAALERFAVKLYKVRYGLEPENWGKKSKSLLAALRKRIKGGESVPDDSQYLSVLKGPYPAKQLSSIEGIRTFLECFHPAMSAQFPPESLRAFAANLSWTVNYYTQTGKADYVAQDPLQRDPTGTYSLHGYETDEAGTVIRAKSDTIIVQDFY